MRDLHVTWAWVTVLSNAVAGLWALGANWEPRLRRRALWVFTALAQAAMFVQVILGILTMNDLGIDRERVEFHMFYGFVALISVAIIYGYRSQLRERLYLLYGLGGLWIMGLGIRAMVLHR